MTAQQIVNDLILDNQNLVIEELMKHDEYLWDELENFDKDTDVLEWWLVIPFMADMLKNNGEVIPIMSKEMNWDTFVSTKEIGEYDRKLRESVRQREQLKQELAELEKKPKDIFWDVEYAMFSAGLKYFNTCSEYWLYKVESEYIKAEKEYLNNPK